MKRMKLTFIMTCIFFICFSTAKAENASIFKVPTSLDDKSANVKLYFPENVSDFGLNVKTNKVAENVRQGNFFAVKIVDIKLSDNSGKTIERLLKPARIAFTFHEVDYKHSSRGNKQLSLGYFRVGYFNETTKTWRSLPSEVFWNGKKGAVEAEIDAVGKYALLWSNEPKAQLSPVAKKGIRLMVNYIPVATDATPYIKDGTTMVPLRVVSANLGVNIEWNAKEKKIELRRNLDKIDLWIGKKEAVKNREEIMLSTAPEVTGSTSFVPLRFIAENLGAKVEWDDATSTVSIVKY
jgi:hypothetical protein